MNGVDPLVLYAGALAVSAVAVTARAWFAYKAVRYQEDTKRQRVLPRGPQESEQSDLQGGSDA